MYTRLHCYIVIDLKVGDSKPEFVGKMNFYQAAVDDCIGVNDGMVTRGSFPGELAFSREF